MSLHDGFAGELVELPLDIGLPYHGLAEGGKLTLPNAAEIDYPTPASGDVHIVRRPGWTMPVRTAGQIEADEAAGFEWRDYAIIVGRLRTTGGTNVLLGGRRIDGWLWFDAGGQPWLVNVLQWSGADNAARQMELRFKRFGVFGGAADQTDVLTNVFDIGQNIAQAVDHRPTQGGSMVTLTANSSQIHHKLIDVTEDGSRALFAAYCLHYAESAGLSGPFVERPLAFYELVIGADKSVTASTLKGRADCIGALDADPGETYDCEVSLLRVVSPETINLSCSVEGGNWTNTWTLETDATSYQFPLTYPIGPVRTIPEVFGRSYSEWMGIGHLADVQTSRAYQCIVGAWYAGSSVRYAQMQLRVSRETSGEHAVTIVNDTFVRSCTAGVQNETDDISFNFSGQSEIIRTAEAVLLIDGSPASVERVESTRTTSMSGSYLYQGSPSHSFSLTGTSTRTVKRNGVTVSSSSDTDTVTDGMFLGSTAFAHLFGLQLISGVDPGITGFSGATMQNALDFLPSAITGADVIRRATVAPWNQTTFGVVAQVATAHGTAVHQFTAAWARGVQVSAATEYTPTPSANINVTPLGTYQPVTAQWSGIVSESTPAPRAWV